MLLRTRLQDQGDFLFRWRGVLPLALIPLALAALVESGSFGGERFGGLFEEIWESAGLAVTLCGAALRVATAGWAPAGTSGRNTRKQKADVLNTTGTYSIVRNPLYLGNLLILLGFTMETEVWWLPLVTALLFALYYERIILREEAFLTGRFGEQYLFWAARTPAFLPRPWLWQRPDLQFSWKTVLRREYNGFYLIVAVFTALEFLSDITEDGGSLRRWDHDWSVWLVVFACSTVIWLSLRVLKRHTTLLRVPGR